jgi:hypothetical protein
MGAVALLVALTGQANAAAAAKQPKGNAACWGDIQRQDISCRALTEEFLLSLRGATRTEVVAAMGVEGRALSESEKDILHFISNFARGEREGSGIINFKFDASGHVAVIFGYIDRSGTDYQFIWNADLLPFGCSDLPNTRMRSCKSL